MQRQSSALRITLAGTVRPPRALYLPDPFLLLIHEPTPTNPCQSDPKRTLRHWLNTRQAAIEGKRKGEELRNHPVPVFKGDALRERGVAVATSNETAFFRLQGRCFPISEPPDTGVKQVSQSVVSY